MTNDPSNPEYNAQARDAIMDLCPFYDPNHKCGVVRDHVFKECLAELRERTRLAEERCKRYAEREDSMRYLSSRNKELERAGAGLVDLLRSARAIAERKGEGTAWSRFDAAIAKAGIGSVTPRTFRILGDDDPEILGQNSLLADLIEQWELRCVVLDELVADAEKTACDETITRLKAKSGVTRSMTAELKREIRNANVRGMARRGEAQIDQTASSASSISALLGFLRFEVGEDGKTVAVFSRSMGKTTFTSEHRGTS